MLMSFSEISGKRMELSQLKIPTACCNHHGWKRTLGENQGYAPELMDMSKGARYTGWISVRMRMTLGIKYLTVYAFSTENWKRPEAEVDALMMLFRKYIKTCYQDGT